MNAWSPWPRYVEEVHELLGTNAALHRDKLARDEQVAAAEEAIQVARLRHRVAILDGEIG